MKYNILIKKCDDAAKVARIAAAIAQWSGSSAKGVEETLASKPLCIRQAVEEQEALKIKAQFEAVGAEVMLVEVSGSRNIAVPPAASVEDDDEEEAPGRVLSEKEYAQVLNGRKDIFIIEKDKRLRNLEVISLVIGVCFGFWLSAVEAVKVSTDYYQNKTVVEHTAKLLKTEELTPDQKKEEEKKREEEKKKAEEEKKKAEKKNTEKGKGKGGKAVPRGGGGDPRARLTRQGVLGIISGQVKGKNVAGADIMGKGGFATNIDAIIKGVGGLKTGGNGGSGRMGAAGIGFGGGYGSGFGGGGGGGGIDDLIGSLMGGGGGGGGETNLELKKRKESLKLAQPDFMQTAALTGGRTKASIMRVVMQNISALRYEYNKRLRDKPGLKGKITIKFAIDEFGKVIFCQKIESTMGDEELETAVTDKIKRWVFDKIDKPGDVTEVTYPFVFSQ